MTASRDIKINILPFQGIMESFKNVLSLIVIYDDISNRMIFFFIDDLGNRLDAFYYLFSVSVNLNIPLWRLEK